MQGLERLIARLRGALGGGDPTPPGRALAMGDLYAQVAGAVEALPDLAERWPWVHDLYVDGEELVAIVSAEGKLYRAPVRVEGATARLGALQEVEVAFAPARARGGFHLQRQADGTHRWFAIAETAVLLRVGEIDSRALFDSFVAHAPEAGYPALRFYHDPRLDFGRADWVARDGHCYLASGNLDEGSPLAQAFIAAAAAGRGRWGCSVGFEVLERETVEIGDGVTVPVYTAGINREISVLPEERAASWFTTVGVEVCRMRSDVREALVTLFGDEEAAEAFIAAVDATNREIETRGLVTREDPPDGEELPDAPGEAEAPPAVELTEEALEAIAGRAREALEPRVRGLEEALQALAERLEGATQQAAELAGRLEALEGSEEEKRQRWQADLPARRTLVVTHRPREARGDDAAPSLAERAEATLAGLS